MEKKLEYTMCAGQRCCPKLIEIEDNKFEIVDDFGGKVILEKEQLVLLKEYLKDNLQ